MSIGRRCCAGKEGLVDRKFRDGDRVSIIGTVCGGIGDRVAVEIDRDFDVMGGGCVIEHQKTDLILIDGSYLDLRTPKFVVGDQVYHHGHELEGTVQAVSDLFMWVQLRLGRYETWLMTSDIELVKAADA